MGWLLEFSKQMAWSLPIAIAFTDLVASVVKVEGPSMQPTFNPDPKRGSDWVLVEKISYKLLYQYNRGDIVVLWAPDNPRMQITKRLIGLENDVVWDDTKPGTETIPQVKRTRTPRLKGRCWIEGDNARRSGDSRTMYGPVHLGLLEGRAVCIVWPPSRMGIVKGKLPENRVIISPANTRPVASSQAYG